MDGFDGVAAAPDLGEGFLFNLANACPCESHVGGRFGLGYADDAVLDALFLAGFEVVDGFLDIGWQVGGDVFRFGTWGGVAGIVSVDELEGPVSGKFGAGPMPEVVVMGMDVGICDDVPSPGDEG